MVLFWQVVVFRFFRQFNHGKEYIVQSWQRVHSTVDTHMVYFEYQKVVIEIQIFLNGRRPSSSQALNRKAAQAVLVAKYPRKISKSNC